MSLLLQYQLGEMMVGLKLWMVKYLANFSHSFLCLELVNI